jgi:hypothetical protein
VSIERRLTDVPDADVDTVISDFVSDGCTATKVKQSNGLWTVVAICPDKRANATRGSRATRSKHVAVAPSKISKPEMAKKKKSTGRKSATRTNPRSKTKSKRKAKSK